ncbi:hypothetical protein [Salinarimonas soli]|uniref:Uncharacterized protein n=1 Tax=Salinarimonas soli TaxID=1638099 RepID=A0A5B2V2H7_9HYPH|nr:hypothetical protein [Salinarimonas soli]KAA2233136.1 hypothetical protein F0L46_24780 [Salinarimonas soli]
MNIIAETDDRSTMEVEFERLLVTFKDHLSPEARGNILGFLHLAGDLPIKTDLSLNAEGQVVLVFSVDGEPARAAEP